MHANTIETTANQQGWTLHTGFAGGQWLETSSPAGEDLIIDVPAGRPIPETVHEHAEQFDPDEHVRALVRSPMKGQPGTIAELLEDAKAIQTMLDRLDAASRTPRDRGGRDRGLAGSARSARIAPGVEQLHGDEPAGHNDAEVGGRTRDRPLEGPTSSATPYLGERGRRPGGSAAAAGSPLAGRRRSPPLRRHRSPPASDQCGCRLR